MLEELSSTCSFISDESDGNLLMGRYELGKLLGRGASAKVYHARDLRTGQSVAIKSVSKQLIFNRTNDHTPGHIMREISIMRKVRHHPHIVHLHEVLATKTKIHFVMEYARGGELFGKIAKRGRFSEDLSRKYFQQLISAVSYCHSRGVFHRDLKPENLLLDENFELKVTDFGLSADQTGQDEMLHTLCGTPAYVAPEVLANKGYDGAKVDAWSCGVILYVLNAGYLPFNDTNLMAMYRKIYRGQFRCPKWTSPDLKRFLSRILDPNPVTRITIQQIMDDPWFQEGGHCNKEIECCYPALGTELDFSHKSRGADSLNAFHLIAFSLGADLSGLLCDSGSRVEKEMFLSRELPERISKRIQELAGEVEEEGVALKVVANKGMGVILQGQNGNFVVMVEINRLTEELVMVEITKGGFGFDFWKTKLKPRLNDLFVANNC